MSLRKSHWQIDNLLFSTDMPKVKNENDEMDEMDAAGLMMGNSCQVDYSFSYLPNQLLLTFESGK